MVKKTKIIPIFKNIKLNKVVNFIYQIFNTLKTEVFHLYQLNIVLVFLIFLILSYFLILVPIKPFSSSYIKQEVSKILTKETGQEFTVDDVLVSFTKTGQVRLDMVNILSSDFSKAIDNSLVDIPEISFAFPLYRLALFDFMPSVLLIEDASFLMDSFNDLSELGGSGSKISGKDQFKFTNSLFNSIKQIKLSGISVKIDNKIKGPVSFFISEAKIKIKHKRGVNKISTDINFETVDDDLNIKKIKIDSHCVLENESLDGNCRLSLANFDLNLISKFFNQQNIFDSIKSDSFFGIIYNKHGKNQKISVNSDSEYFNIFAKDYFSSPLSLRNFNFDMVYDFSKDNLIMNSLKSDIVFKKEEEKEIEIEEYSSRYIVSNLKSDFSITGLTKPNSANINIELINVNQDNIIDLWPLFLPKQNIRDWVSKHFSSGVMSFGSINMKFAKDLDSLDVVRLNSLNAEVLMKNTSLNYSDKFPKIKDLDVKFTFDKGSMVANIYSGKVLNTKILGNSTVKIDDFSNPLLDIGLAVEGSVIDLFRHIDHRSKKISKKFGKIFKNSISNSNVNIKLPLTKRSLSLSDFYIKIRSNVSDIENDVFAGKVALATEKNFNSNEFISNINLDKAFTHRKNALGIKKLHSDKMNLGFRLSIDSGLTKLSSLFLKLNNSKDIIKSSMIYNNKKGKLVKFYLKNSGHENDYVFNYGFNGKSSIFSLNGSKISLIPPQETSKDSVVNSKEPPFSFFNIFYLKNFEIKAKIENIENSELSSKNINLELKCQNYLCKKGFFISNYKEDNSILTDLVISRESKNSYKITGNINDFGYFAQLYNISDDMKDGSIKVNISQNIDYDRDEVLYEGRIDLDKGSLTLYNNPTLKKLESDNMFLTVKDKIFSNNKTTFSRIKSEFIISPKLSVINIKSFIANNLKIGITSKGYYDYNSGNARLKGAIIPGYIINNLFGIGNIPILGNVVSGVLTGSKDSGLFGLNYEYKILSHGKEAEFKTFPAKSLVPSSIQNLFN